MSNIKTKPINLLVRNAGTKNNGKSVEQYVIPAYQRGYRWTQLHVKALLEDIDSFLKNQSEVGAVKESYCLQPIVVVERLDISNHQMWEIIDGQQRLITLYIILKRLHRTKFEIKFDKRPKSTEFLINLSIDSLDDETPDTHFISDAYRCINNWFTEKEAEEIGYEDSFATILYKQVQVIWYEVELKTQTDQSSEPEKIDIFNRLNIGKIPLEDAELVRALFMSKVEGASEREKLMRQAELSNEWFEIENWLQQKEVWGFLTNKTFANHIQLIFELLAHNKNSDNYNTYKWFEQQLKNSDNPIKKASELWKEVKLVFSKFREWYNNRTLYHYIGFLLSIGEIKIDELLIESDNDKLTFLKGIHNRIIKYLDDIDLSSISYENNPGLLKNVLLLFNVLSVEQLINSPYNTFPFNLYNDIKKDTKWSLEHIHAQQSQDPLQKTVLIREWINDTLSSISPIRYIDKTGNIEDRIDLSSIKEELKALTTQEQIDKDVFNNLRVRIIRIFESESTKHLLDNMALLSCPDNSKLNNAIFPVKRDRIIEMEREGRFIPPCTRNVFLKLYSKENNQPYYWNKTDKEDYITEINRVFTEFKNKAL